MVVITKLETIRKVGRDVKFSKMDTIMKLTCLQDEFLHVEIAVCEFQKPKVNAV